MCYNINEDEALKSQHPLYRESIDEDDRRYDYQDFKDEDQDYDSLRESEDWEYIRDSIISNSSDNS